MTSRAQHYREAERLLSESEGPSWANTPTPWSPRPRSAPPRATLATISDDAYNEYLDLRSLKETREGWPGRRRRRAVTGSRTTTNERPRTKRRAITLPAGAEERAAKVRPAPALRR